MITSRTTSLVRAPSLRAFQRALVRLVGSASPAERRTTAVLVPSRASGEQLRRTLEAGLLGADQPALLLPDLLTRTDFYDRLRASLGQPLFVLPVHAREAILLASAHEAITNGVQPPFELRPGLVSEMLELYDALRRQRQTVDDFSRLLTQELEPRAATDRGAERMLRQTLFLTAAFQGYEQRLAQHDAADEHTLRDRLLLSTRDPRYTHVLVTMADNVFDPGGLWPADFDLLSRLHGLQAVTVFATEAQLAAGWLERLHDLLPGMEEQKLENLHDHASRVLVVPDEVGATADGRSAPVAHFVSRDREEELADVARHIKTTRRHPNGHAPRLDRTAVVFRRPLPYLYLGKSVFGSARIAFQFDDALPLAGEPAAAALDLVLTVVATGASRAALTALLRSPHYGWGEETAPLPCDSIAAFDEALADAQYTGDPDRLRAIVDSWDTPGAEDRQRSRRKRARAAAAVALEALQELQPLFETRLASEQLATIRQFVARHTTGAAVHSQTDDRQGRAHAAIVATLDDLEEAHRTYGDLPWSIDETAATVRRALERQTFRPRGATDGVQLIDATAARYGAFDTVCLVGMVEGEWPERIRRNLFYSPFLLSGLGWRDERTRAQWARAEFLDLLQLADSQVRVSTFLLEEDSLVEPSPLLDELALAPLDRAPAPRDPTVIFTGEALMLQRAPREALDPHASRSMMLRDARSNAAAPVFHGTATAHRPAVHSVSALELYVQCPFKYFARYVLRLPEEVVDEDGLGPRQRGTFVHTVFQRFFERWQASPGGAITADNLDAAYSLLEEVLSELLPTLGPADAALERTRLLGSPVAPGLADVVFTAEAMRPVQVVRRRLEDRFEGVYELQGPDGPRHVPIRGIVDRIDLLADGTLRVIDYKSSTPHRPVQLAIYAVTSTERLRGELGRNWRVAEASYIVFGAERNVKPLARRPADLDQALADAQVRVLDAIDGIERGAFPPRPAHTHLCSYCAYAAVCRKDFVSDDDE